MSFQKAHKVANELAEVVVSAYVDLTSASSTRAFQLQPAVSGTALRVLEVGFTVGSAGTAAVSDQINVGTMADPGKFVNSAGIAGVQTTVPANPADGATFSTSKGGASTWLYNPAGLDSDGNPVLSVGESLSYSVSAGTANGSTGILFVRLAPIPSKDVFE